MGWWLQSVETAKQMVEQLRLHGRREEALEWLHRLREVDPGADAWYLFQAGVLQELFHKQEEALALYDQAEAAVLQGAQVDHVLLEKVLSRQARLRPRDEAVPHRLADVRRKLERPGWRPTAALWVAVALVLIVGFWAARYEWTARSYLDQARQLEQVRTADPVQTTQALTLYELVAREFPLSPAHEEAVQGVNRMRRQLSGQLRRLPGSDRFSSFVPLE